MWMPTARYSCRAMSPNARVIAVSSMAAKPSASGHCENVVWLLTPGRYWKWLRGSVLIVSGMPSRERPGVGVQTRDQVGDLHAVDQRPDRRSVVLAAHAGCGHWTADRAGGA